MPQIDLEQLETLSDSLSDAEITFAWNSAGLSDVGRVRKVNEDAYLSSHEQQLWAVADGMGGHSRGDYASKTVVESLLYFSPRRSLRKSIIELDSCLKKAHDVCRTTFPSERVGSTVAALYAQADYGFFIWLGDSRIYRLRDGQLEQMTSDHTVAQEKCDRGELSPLMAALHPSAHVLTRAIGINFHLTIDIHYAKIQAGDRYLLCSDGLYNELEHKEILHYLAQGTPQQAVAELLAYSLKQGGKDNTTAIVVDAIKQA
ncbi:PP2C family protein-serine/threonine phosphatase [Reinekea thalattae]|uniref:Serine/threonine-protein phosphatase n=1 Tax=Reinekea thalattae TaxID=2593301 RepID=A0A5C8Z7S8_9GAMM|nr:protein phosphatase 2C domain-containing protein [Reinekea thalattae]TXR54145.1 serine/threonine-protein phosphatase [Reinekea thalattae]